MASNLSALDPRLQPYARYIVEYARWRGWSPQVTSTRRSRAEQTALYNRYLRGESKYPAAAPGHSRHELGLALDIVTVPESALAALGAVWRRVGGVWSPSDAVHFTAP